MTPSDCGSAHREPSAALERVAREILAAFDRYNERFQEITGRSKARFEARDWAGVVQDAQQRLALYRFSVDAVEGRIASALGEDAHEPSVWLAVRNAYSLLVQDRYEADLAHTFFNSVGRRFLRMNVAAVTYREDLELPPPDADSLWPAAAAIARVYPWQGDTAALVRQVLLDYPFESGWEDLPRDAERAAERIGSFLREALLTESFDAIHMVGPMFFRNKAVFLIGGIAIGGLMVPLVFVLRHGERGVVVHAALIEEGNAGNLFSNTRSNFHVEVSRHRDLIRFLHGLLPEKQLYELYAGIGYYHHARTELYEHLFLHLERTGEKFERPAGTRGKVMAVFALPTFPMVFKIIRDRFEPPKTVTRADVERKYQFVRFADRAGRMLDALPFGDLKFRKEQFRPEVLEELCATCASTVTIDGGDVIVGQVFVQRHVVPLPEFLRRTKDLRRRRDAIIDFGYLIKDLAGVNIFLGDYLLRNFGVTSYRRIVSFDYDELDLLTSQRFLHMPEARDDEEELSGSYIESMVVEDTDVFPEEFERFLGIPSYLMPAFKAHHADLFTPAYYQSLQERLKAHEIIDITSMVATSLQPATG